MSIQIQKVTDASFSRYGKIIEGITCDELLNVMKEIEIPSDVVYEASIEALESTTAAKDLGTSVYGGMPIQLGYCIGHNDKLNAVEYHRDSEVNIAVTDMILLLGSQQDIVNYTYDTSKIEAFLIPAGTMIEVYATTLHYAPCSVADTGFQCIVVLPNKTNTDLLEKPAKTKEDELLFARNKWLISHKDAKIAGSFEGLIGENISTADSIF